MCQEDHSHGSPEVNKSWKKPHPFSGSERRFAEAILCELTGTGAYCCQYFPFPAVSSPSAQERQNIARHRKPQATTCALQSIVAK